MEKICQDRAGAARRWCSPKPCQGAALHGVFGTMLHMLLVLASQPAMNAVSGCTCARWTVGCTALLFAWLRLITCRQKGWMAGRVWAWIVYVSCC